MKAKQKPKDLLYISSLLTDTVAEALEVAERIVKKPMPKYEDPDDLSETEARLVALKEQMAMVKALRLSGDANKLGAACFHLGVMVGTAAHFPGRKEVLAGKWDEAQRIEITLYEKNGVWPTARKVWQALSRDRRWPVTEETSFATEFSKHRRRPHNRR